MPQRVINDGESILGELISEAIYAFHVNEMERTGDTLPFSSVTAQKPPDSNIV